VRASGDIDLATAPELDRVLRAAVTPDQPDRHLVLDLAAVTFLNGSGLRPLVRARRRLNDRFWLANPSRQVRRLLDLTALTHAFAVIDILPPTVLVPRHRSSLALAPPTTGTEDRTVSPAQVASLDRVHAPVTRDATAHPRVGDEAT
jgi:anti-anti-sigma factor